MAASLLIKLLGTQQTGQQTTFFGRETRVQSHHSYTGFNIGFYPACTKLRLHKLPSNTKTYCCTCLLLIIGSCSCLNKSAVQRSTMRETVLQLLLTCLTTASLCSTLKSQLNCFDSTYYKNIHIFLVCEINLSVNVGMPGSPSDQSRKLQYHRLKVLKWGSTCLCKCSFTHITYVQGLKRTQAERKL